MQRTPSIRGNAVRLTENLSVQLLPALNIYNSVPGKAGPPASADGRFFEDICLGHFGRHSGSFQAGNEQVPQAVEVGEQAVVVTVAEEIRPDPLALLRFRLCLVQPPIPSGDQVPLDHFVRFPLRPARHPAGYGEQRLIRPQVVLGRQPVAQLTYQLRVQDLGDGDEGSESSSSIQA